MKQNFLLRKIMLSIKKIFMNKKKLPKKTIFLHIPKTAGQSIRAEFIKEIGNGVVSDIQTYDQAESSCFEEVNKYDFYSGHIDFEDLNRKFSSYETFVFTILRDPKERIASFYLYLKKEAELLNPDELNLSSNTGKKNLLENSIEEYFFSSDASFKKFIDDMYMNFYVRYFCQKTYRSNPNSDGQVVSLEKALNEIENLDLIGFIDNLDFVSKRIKGELGVDIDLKKRKINANKMIDTKWNIFRKMCDEENKTLTTRIQSYFLEEDLLFYNKLKVKYEN
tara:strand:+ start:605 stop:1441 length:837 start_codon:yes stop_codon:yes gene_type:complete